MTRKGQIALSNKLREKFEEDRRMTPSKTDEVCECGHNQDKHRNDGLDRFTECEMLGCSCKKFTPKIQEKKEVGE